MTIERKRLENIKSDFCCMWWFSSRLCNSRITSSELLKWIRNHWWKVNKAYNSHAIKFSRFKEGLLNFSLVEILAINPKNYLDITQILKYIQSWYKIYLKKDL